MRTIVDWQANSVGRYACAVLHMLTIMYYMDAYKDETLTLATFTASLPGIRLSFGTKMPKMVGLCYYLGKFCIYYYLVWKLHECYYCYIKIFVKLRHLVQGDFTSFGRINSIIIVIFMSDFFFGIIKVSCFVLLPKYISIIKLHNVIYRLVFRGIFWSIIFPKMQKS